MAVIFDAEALAFEAAAPEEVLQIVSGRRAVAVDPDADVFDDRGVLGLAQVRGAGEEHDLAVGAQDQALKEAEAEGVVAGEPVHALLLEHEERIKAAFVHGLECTLPTFGKLVCGEMQCHAHSSLPAHPVRAAV